MPHARAARLHCCTCIIIGPFGRRGRSGGSLRLLLPCGIGDAGNQRVRQNLAIGAIYFHAVADGQAFRLRQSKDHRGKTGFFRQADDGGAACGIKGKRAEHPAAQRQIGSIRAGVSKSGATMAGTPLAVLSESAANAEIDALNTRYSGQREAALYFMFMYSSAAGPRMTMNSTGRKNTIMGTVSFGGRAAALRSASDWRISRFSFAMVRSAVPTGVP